MNFSKFRRPILVLHVAICSIEIAYADLSLPLWSFDETIAFTILVPILFGWLVMHDGSSFLYGSNDCGNR